MLKQIGSNRVPWLTWYLNSDHRTLGLGIVQFTLFFIYLLYSFSDIHLEGVHVTGLDGVEPHEVPGQPPGQPRQGGAVLDGLPAVINPNPLKNTILSHFFSTNGFLP